ncbi:hypothetical protein SAMN04488045_0876 [Thalassococcus halodurans]|uniref:Uncharacterized protein n=1 Tax=Thalassococcus halodurans TaxID=373675 RepID=A0A1H5U652_9RHOB|nr:hypothetical protein [Thalassococcus halodurans]SEF70480.1 hypothetical protein SAMN04488045_0876 [Thalassococcus halodurans]
MKLRVILSAALAISANSAAAQPNCGDRARVIDHLQQRFGETQVAVQWHDDLSVVEVFQSAQTQTWTILRTQPNGLTCLIASGLEAESIATLMGNPST